MKFDYSGFDEMNTVAARMGDSKRETLDASQKLVRSAGYAMVSWGQRFAVVDTGFLRSGIAVDFDGSAVAGFYRATAGPTAEYAPYVEFGTSKMAPRAFMGPALDRVSPAFVAAAEAITADPIGGPGVGSHGSF